MPIEGDISVSLLWDGRRVRQVGVRSTRPALAARVAVGRSPAEAARLLPSLFAICGQAQGAAAAGALRAAGAEPADIPELAVWTVPLEAAQETFWRMLIDAPRALALAPQAAAVAGARAAVAQAIAALRVSPSAPKAALAAAAAALDALARDHVYGRDAAAWVAETDLAAFDRWRATTSTLPARMLAIIAATAPRLGRSDTALMPGLDDDGWWSKVVPALQSEAAFAQAPTWNGEPVETGALARTHAHPLVAALIERDGRSAATRIAARLVELAGLLDALRGGDADAARWVQAWPLGPGEGLAAAQTARGLLVHHARLGEGRVTGYRIVAPTDWNFHPEGALARGLVGTEAGDEATLRKLAGVAVQALDPCVACRVEVQRHA
jgi:hypothetical protein